MSCYEIAFFSFFYLIKPLPPSVCLTQQTGILFPLVLAISGSWESSTFPSLLLLLCRRTDGIDPPRQSPAEDPSGHGQGRNDNVKKSPVSRRVCPSRLCPVDLLVRLGHPSTPCPNTGNAVTGDPFPFPQHTSHFSQTTADRMLLRFSDMLLCRRNYLHRNPKPHSLYHSSTTLRNPPLP
jgi:hypothetical protein